MPNQAQAEKSKNLKDLKETVKFAENMRTRQERPVDVSFQDVVKHKYGLSLADYYADLGINFSRDTVQNIIEMPNEDFRWALPEIYRAAYRAGMRRSPFFQDLIATTQAVKGLTVQQPMINMSDAMPLYTGIAESIRIGDISLDQREVSIRKFARGIVIPYEVKKFITLDVLNIFIEDFGVLAGQALTNQAIYTLVNGDQKDGSAAAAVIGVKTPGTLVYRDLTRPYVRGGLLGKAYTDMVAGEDMALDIMDLDQFSKPVSGSPEKRLNVKTPMPQASDLYVHGGVATDQVIILDPRTALVKYDAQPLLVESEKIVSNQTDAVYMSFITGFGNLFQDSRIIVDKSLDIATNGFPSYMGPLAIEAANVFKK